MYATKRFWASRFLLGAVVGLVIAIGPAHAASVTLHAAGGSNRIALPWEVSGHLANVQVMRDTDANPSGRRRVAIPGAGARSFTDTTVQAGRQYWYWVKYTDTAGAGGNSNACSATANGATSGAVGFGRNVTG